MMQKVTRFGVSLEKEMLQAFDGLIDDRGYPNRSQAIRDLIREALREEGTQAKGKAQVGVLALVFDHHKPGLVKKLTHNFHDHPGETVASMHVHISHKICLEVVVLKGKTKELRALSSKIRAIKGVLLGDLFLVPTGKEQDH